MSHSGGASSAGNTKTLPQAEGRAAEGAAVRKRPGRRRVPTNYGGHGATEGPGTGPATSHRGSRDMDEPHAH